MTSAPKKAKGRTLAEFWPLLPAENILLSACENGDIAAINNERPLKPTGKNQIRASFLRFLLLGGDEKIAIHEHGIQLIGAWIEEKLDLNDAVISFPLELDYCNFSAGIGLNDATLHSVFSLCNSRLFSNEKYALSFDRADIKGDVYLRRTNVCGYIRLIGASIGGDLNCSDATFENENKIVLNADNAIIKGNVYFNNSYINGKSSYYSTKINGHLIYAGASLDNKNASVIYLDSLKIDGCVFLNETKIKGQISCIGANINGSIDLNKINLNNKQNYAIIAHGVNIKGAVFLREANVMGIIEFIGAEIGDSIDCKKAIFYNPGDTVFCADRAIVKGDVNFDSCTINGKIKFSSAKIDGDFNCNNTFLDNINGATLVLENTIINKNLNFQFLNSIENCSLSLTTVGSLVDKSTSWGNNINLNGFIYGGFSGAATTDAMSRLMWLDKQTLQFSGLDKDNNNRFRPQPWRQLQKVLREMGHAEDARQVAIAFENRLSKAGLIGQAPKEWNKFRRFIYRQLSNGFHFLFRVLIGYGYRPIRLVAWMISVWLCCAALFWYSALQGVMGPSNPLIFQNPSYAACVPDSAEAKVEIEKLELNQLGIKNGLPIAMDQIAISGAGNWYLCAKLREEYTGLSPLAYSLDLILPLVNLQQDSDWAPLIPTPESSRWYEYTNITLKHITRFFVWFEILFGWLASLLMVAVVSGLTKRRED